MTSNRDDLFIQRASDNYKSSATACKLQEFYKCLERNALHPVMRLALNNATDEFSIRRVNQMLSQTTLTKNYNNNQSQYEDALRVFRKTDGMETLLQHLSALLSPDEFRMLWILEMNKIELQVVFVDENGNRTSEKVEA